MVNDLARKHFPLCMRTLHESLQRDNHLTYVFVSHNLAVVSEISDRVAVMKTGRIVELGECDQVLHESRHDYTKALVAAVPEPEPSRA